MTEDRSQHAGFHIRACRREDLHALRRICAVCDDTARPERLVWVLPMYLDYYVECCPETCFAAVDETDTPVGYLLCAPDYPASRRSFRRNGYLGAVWKGDRLQALKWLASPLVEKHFAAGVYPAHLHIDLMPAYQRTGLGSQLMDTLTAALRARGVGGVMLSCGTENEKGNRFYQKYGFRFLGSCCGGNFYGLRLT